MPLLDEDYLILSTIHSAKGQEWTSVFVLNVVDGCIPSDLGVGTTPEIEEERRLLYVAMTRAKDQLHLMVPQRFFTHGQRGLGDRHVYAQRTRFIPASLTRHFQNRSWPPPKATGRGRSPATGGHESQDAEHVGLNLARISHTGCACAAWHEGRQGEPCAARCGARQARRRTLSASQPALRGPAGSRRRRAESGA